MLFELEIQRHGGNLQFGGGGGGGCQIKDF